MTIQAIISRKGLTMLTDEQMAKGKKALQDHKSKMLRQKILLELYRADQEKAERWQLPFRMVHKAEYIPGEVPPNDYFPHLSRVGKDADGRPYTIADAERITPETALYYFTRQLAANEDRLKTYRPSDWMGISISRNEAEKQLRAYLERIQDYHDHPERYDTEPHQLQKERYFICDVV